MVIETLVFFPVLILFVCCAASACLASAVIRQRRRQVAAALLVIIAGSLAYWRGMDWVEWIPFVFLICCCAVGIHVGRQLTRHIPRRVHIVRILRNSAGVCMVCLIPLYVLMFFRRYNEVVEQVRSPDGTYKATFYEGGCLVSTYELVTIEEDGWHLLRKPAMVAAVEYSGLNGVSWQNNRTLVINYRSEKNGTEPLDAASFTRQKLRWRDVQIIYREEPPH